MHLVAFLKNSSFPRGVNFVHKGDQDLLAALCGTTLIFVIFIASLRLRVVAFIFGRERKQHPKICRRRNRRSDLFDFPLCPLARPGERVVKILKSLTITGRKQINGNIRPLSKYERGPTRLRP